MAERDCALVALWLILHRQTSVTANSARHILLYYAIAAIGEYHEYLGQLVIDCAARFGRARPVLHVVPHARVQP
jgi:hypothetical protein